MESIRNTLGGWERGLTPQTINSFRQNSPGLIIWNPVHKATLKLLNDFRERLRQICHQPRWVEWPKIAEPKEAEKKIIVKGPAI